VGGLWCCCKAPFAQGQVVSLESIAKAPSSIEQEPALDLSNPDVMNLAKPRLAEETERAKRFDKPNRPPLINRSEPLKSGQHYIIGQYQYNSDHTPLPVAGSDLIVLGTVSSASPHLSSGGNTVYSTFRLEIKNILKGVLAPSESIVTVEREGGIILLPNGKKRFEGIRGLGLPVNGFTYILFLKARPSSHSYSIITGYAVVEGKLISLDAANASEDDKNADALITEIKVQH